MPRGRPLNPPIYTLPHGIEVIGEYAPTVSNPYWRVRIRPHPFFDAVDACSGHYIRRSRVVLASKLGRALTSNETAHHRNEVKTDDRPDNLELLSAGAHNTHHKLEISRATGQCRFMLARRLPEAEADWLVRRGQERTCTVSKRRACTWYGPGVAEQQTLFPTARRA